MPDAYKSIYSGWPWENNDDKVKNNSESDEAKFEKVIGKSNKADAKIAGITPAVFILKGKWGLKFMEESHRIYH